MLQIQKVGKGSIDVTDFVDDDTLRKEHAKQGSLAVYVKRKRKRLSPEITAI
jgi:hypothetical protein